MTIRTRRIYKIISTRGNETCVGSTFNRLSDRFRMHRNNYSCEKNNCSTDYFFDKYGITNCKIVLIKEYEVYAETAIDKKHLSVYETL
jgi:hypothetical protein